MTFLWLSRLQHRQMVRGRSIIFSVLSPWEGETSQRHWQIGWREGLDVLPRQSRVSIRGIRATTRSGRLWQKGSRPPERS